MTEREFWRFLWVCLRILWMGAPHDFWSIPRIIGLSLYTIVLFVYKRWLHVPG
jgi:hypothetical protein